MRLESGALAMDQTDMHEIVAQAWRVTIGLMPRRNSSQLHAGAEAAHHLLRAGRYDLLPTLASALPHSGHLEDEPATFVALIDDLPADIKTRAIDPHVMAIHAQALEASALRGRLIGARGGARNPVLYVDEALCLHAQGEAEQALAVLDQAEARSRGQRVHDRFQSADQVVG